jgi:hypothetical protein
MLETLAEFCKWGALGLFLVVVYLFYLIIRDLMEEFGEGSR